MLCEQTKGNPSSYNTRVNLPNSLPQGVIATNAVAGLQGGLDHLVTVIKIPSLGSSADDKGNQTPAR